MALARQGDETYGGGDHTVDHGEKDHVYQNGTAREFVGRHVGQVGQENTAEAEQGMEDTFAACGDPVRTADHVGTCDSEGKRQEHEKYVGRDGLIQILLNDPLHQQKEQGERRKDTARAYNQRSDDGPG